MADPMVLRNGCRAYPKDPNGPVQALRRFGFWGGLQGLRLNPNPQNGQT